MSRRDISKGSKEWVRMRRQLKQKNPIARSLRSPHLRPKVHEKSQPRERLNPRDWEKYEDL